MKTIPKERFIDMCHQARVNARPEEDEASLLQELIRLLHTDLGREEPGLILSSDPSLHRFWREIDTLFSRRYEADFDITSTIKRELLQKA